MSQCCDAVEHRYELVPKKVKEDEFWRNYFYRVGLAKQSFELAPVAPITSTATAKPTNSNASANRWRITAVNCSSSLQFSITTGPWMKLRMEMVTKRMNSSQNSKRC